MHASMEIRNPNSSKRMTADPRLKPSGHWDRLQAGYVGGMCVMGGLWEMNRSYVGRMCITGGLWEMNKSYVGGMCVNKRYV